MDPTLDNWMNWSSISISKAPFSHLRALPAAQLSPEARRQVLQSQGTVQRGFHINVGLGGRLWLQLLLELAFTYNATQLPNVCRARGFYWEQRYISSLFDLLHS